VDPALRPSDVDAERDVILDEILMHADEPSDLAPSSGWRGCSRPSARRDTLGTAESVGQLGADQIRAFFERHYRPENIVVAVAGDCHHDQVAAEVESRFRGTAGGVAPPRSAPALRAEPLRTASRPTEQPTSCSAPAPPAPRRAPWASAVLNQTLAAALEPPVPKDQGAARPRVLGVVRARHL